MYCEYYKKYKQYLKLARNKPYHGLRIGDKIDIKKSSWITHFTGRSLTQDNQKSWAVIKDGGNFDQFTGATITPRAVVRSIKTSLIWQQNQSDLFTRPNQCGVNNESN